MKSAFLSALIAVLSFSASTRAFAREFCYQGHCYDPHPEPISREAAQVIRHIVSFKFKAGVTADKIQEVVLRFLALKDEIPSIVTLESGTNISPEGLNKGFTHTFVLTFSNLQNRDAYLSGNLYHEAFKKFVGPLLDDVFVFDYISE